MHIYIYIYIYICVCVCVCVCDIDGIFFYTLQPTMVCDYHFTRIHECMYVSMYVL